MNQTSSSESSDENGNREDNFFNDNFLIDPNNFSIKAIQAPKVVRTCKRFIPNRLIEYTTSRRDDESGNKSLTERFSNLLNIQVCTPITKANSYALVDNHLAETSSRSRLDVENSRDERKKRLLLWKLNSVSTSTPSKRSSSGLVPECVEHKTKKLETVYIKPTEENVPSTNSKRKAPEIVETEYVSPLVESSIISNGNGSNESSSTNILELDTSEIVKGSDSSNISSKKNLKESLTCEIEEIVDYYAPGSHKLKAHIDYELEKISKFNNFDITGPNVYFHREDFDTQIERFDASHTMHEYPGCLVSRQVLPCGTLLGILKIEPATIRPYQFVESKTSLLFWVLEGGIVLKTNSLQWNGSNEKQIFVKRHTYKAGEVIILPSGTPFSFENHSVSTVSLGFSSHDKDD